MASSLVSFRITSLKRTYKRLIPFVVLSDSNRPCEKSVLQCRHTIIHVHLYFEEVSFDRMNRMRIGCGDDFGSNDVNKE